MALHFRVDPISFSCDEDLTEAFLESESEKEFCILGHAVILTRDKRRKFIVISPLPVSYDDFRTSFQAWLATFSSKQQSAARKRFDRLGGKGIHARERKSEAARPPAAADGRGGETAHQRKASTATQGFDEAKAAEAGAANGGYGHARSSSTATQGFDQAAAAAGRAYAPHGEAESRRASEGASGSAASGAQRSGTQESSTATSRSASRRESAAQSGYSSTTEGFAEGEARANTKAAATFEQAARTSKAAAEMETANTKMAARFSAFNLGSAQRARRFQETHVPVARGDYKKIRSSLVNGEAGGYVITGPTGCGKSTVALLPLFRRGVSVLVVEPTQANAANIYHEFKNILPNLFAAGVIHSPIPRVQFVAPTVSKPPFAALRVTTTDKLLEYFEYYGKLPTVDYLVLDEFHLPIPTMVTAVELLRTFELVPKYVLVSATAVGFSVSPQLPEAVTPIYGQLEVGKLPVPVEGSDLDPRRWTDRGDGTVGVVAPSESVARRLYTMYVEWGLRAFLITRHTMVSEYMVAAANYVPRTVFVLEPGVEAGVTLSMAVLVSMGATTAVRYDGRVVIEDTQPLDSVAAIQRGGRGGRVVPTLYISPRTPDKTVGSSSADYYRAQAVVKMVAAGADGAVLDDRGLYSVFPRLRELSRSLAVSAVASGVDPFVAVYQRNTDGAVYRECGGSGEGFSALAAKELYLYHYDTGFFVAPIADLSDVACSPDTFVERRSQLTAARAMVDAVKGLADKYPLDELVGMVVGKFSTYADDLFLLLGKVFSGTQPTPFSLDGASTQYPEIHHFLGSAPPVLKLFEYMSSQPAGVRAERVEIPGTVARATHSFYYGKRVLHFSFDAKYMRGSSLDTTLLTRDVYELLKQLLAVEILINGAPDKCVDLRVYRDRVPKENKWYSAAVRGA